LEKIDFSFIISTALLYHPIPNEEHNPGSTPMKLYALVAAVHLASAIPAISQIKQSDFAKPPTPAQEAEAIRLFETGNACPDTDSKCRIDAFTGAIAAYPGFADAYNNRGSAYLSAGRHTEALADFERALASDPGSVQALYNRAVLYSEAGELSKSISDFQAVITRQPELGLAFTGLGGVLMKQERFDAAELSFTRAIQLQPGFALNYFNRGLAFMFRDQFVKAESDFSKALAIDDDITPALLNRSVCLREKGDLRAALADINEYIVRRPDDARGYRTRANLFAKMGERTKAEADERRSAGLK
jgi:tetratricopeptide (TPR) repeat protein